MNRFYVVGGTLQRDAPCYVERQADEDLYSCLSQGKFCYVLTSRQMGKSSLMVRTAARLRVQGTGVAVLDLTAIGQNVTAEQWYDGLLARIGQQLDLEDELEEFWLSHGRLGPLQRWSRAIREVVLPRYVRQVAIFVDEIDAVRSLAFSTDEFFAAIREFYNRRTEDRELARLTFCLLGVATPSDLIRDIRTTPFNIGQRIELNDFTGTEVKPLSHGLGRKEKLADALLQRVLYWTGGHPYLTQRLCQAVAEDASISGSAGVDRLCERLFLSSRSRERDDNLLFVRERMLRSEVHLASLLDLYSRVVRHKSVRDDETNPLINILHLSGITRVNDGHLYVRNRIYSGVFDHEWVTANMPDAERRRQRAAYWRGVLRATAFAAVIVLVIAILAVIAIQQRKLAEAERNRAEQQERANQRILYAAQMTWVQEAWETSEIGTMLKLLTSLVPKPGQEDLRAFEWYYFWQICHKDLMTLPHVGGVSSMAFSSDGKTLISASEDKTMRLWDTATGHEVRTFKGHAERVRAVAFSPDDKSIASGSDDRTVKLWDTNTGQERLTLTGHNDRVWSVAFSPDGKKIASGSFDRTVKLWDIATGRELRTLKGHKNQTGNCCLVWSVAFSPDGKKLASGSSDRTVKLWDTATGRELFTLKGHNDEVSSVAFSPDGTKLVSGSYDQTVKLWELARGRELFTLKGHKEQVWSVVFSPDGKSIASGSRDRTVKVWKAATGQELLTLKGHVELVSSVAFSPNENRIASASYDQTVKLWDTATTQESLTLKGHKELVSSVAFAPHGKMIASASHDRTVKLWDTATGQELRTLKGHADSVWSVAFSPDTKKIASGSRDQSVKVWEVTTGWELLTFKGHAGPVRSVAFSPGGQTLASGSWDGTVKLWDLSKGREPRTLEGHAWSVFSVAFSPDGQRLASAGSDRTVRLWDLTTGRELLTLRGHSTSVLSVAFSQDKDRLASGSADGSVKLWDLILGRELLTLKVHTGPVWSVAFSPDGKELVAGSSDNSLTLWIAATDEEVQAQTGVKRTSAREPAGEKLGPSAKAVDVEHQQGKSR
jgi:WD40 repeat protein